MKASRRITALALAVLGGLLCTGGPAFAAIEWTEKKELKLEVSPIDMTTSPDGKWVVVLSKGAVLVYSIPDYTMVGRTPVDTAFDTVAFSQADDTVIVSSSTAKTVKFIQLDVVHTFSLAGHPFKGPEKAPVTIVVFSDYQCPYCARVEPFLMQVLDKYPKDVKLVLKNFPLPMHAFAHKAAAAALAADRQGKFWEMSTKLFEKGPQLNDEAIQGLAKELGLNMKKFNRDLNDPSIQNLINNDLNEAQQASVQGTPSIFINGKALKNRGPNEFWETLEAELKGKK